MTLSAARVVLVNPLYSGNLGAVARLAANFDVGEVVVVSPRCDISDPEARRYATGVSVENLAAFRRVDTLFEALEGCARRIAFSCRQSLLSLPEVKLSRCSDWLVPSGSFALVFGPEDAGLRREDLALCSEVCSLPVSFRKNSLNLSHAVAVVLSRLFDTVVSMGEEAADCIFTGRSAARASSDEIDVLMGRWHAAIVRLGFDARTGPEAMAGKIRNALLRADLTSHEVATFHAFLNASEKNG
jgi:TrmH family RNA methyltransferase